MNKVDEWTVRMGDEGPLHNKNRKRSQVFFNSDVLDCVDYVECMADKFAHPDVFKQAVARKLTEHRHRKPCIADESELISERDWSQHLRIQLAAEVEKVNKLQKELAAEREISAELAEQVHRAKALK